ncbi:Fumarylacetoacetase [Lachnellula suecica]|uniref:Fumarylacetoacetase n=1 Tax=Lachnellula suecica TaxID=602035 RepID=A0A8T9CB19_9HELO|nr:Fumarylacetoacetase [Lachnellula suecica]
MALQSWLPVPKGSHFSLANLPFGIISNSKLRTPRPAIAIGEDALDLSDFAKNGGFSELPSIKDHIGVFSERSLNSFAALGRPVHREVRSYLQSILSIATPYPSLLKDNQALKESSILSLKDVTTHLPLEIGDYTDFFAGVNHAFNIGTLFRGPENALQPNYTHLPVAYHGRASSVVVSGTPIHRPYGQIIVDPAATPKVPTFTPCRRLDIELEMGMFVCKGNKMGKRIGVNSAEDSIFGYVLMNDWSARDVQMWEYVPLGPFNAKNFGTTISAWVVLADALEPFRVTGLENKTTLQEYLRQEQKESVFDIALEVDLTIMCLAKSMEAANGNTTTITRTNACNLLWSFPQMLAHHAVSGCTMRVGDLLGSGTISGTESGTQGSLLEQIQGGKVALKLNHGEERKFLQDGDTISIRGVAGQDENSLVGFGSCVGRIDPAIPF